MGIFDELASDIGFENSDLIAHGTLARGEIITVKPTGVYRGGEGDQSNQAAVCDVEVQVIPLDGSPRYQASVRHAIPVVSLPRLQTPGAGVAVRVDPKDKTRIELDLLTDAPDAPLVFTDAPAYLMNNDGGARSFSTHLTVSEILATGKPCTVRVGLVFPTGDNDASGHPTTGLTLTVHPGSGSDFSAQIGVWIPDAATTKVTVGANLPAKWIDAGTGNTDDNLVVPDWGKI